MAGLLNSFVDALEPIWSQSYYTNKRKEDRAKKLGLLVDEYSKPQWQKQDPLLMQQGPTQTPMVEGRRGLLDPQTQQQFALKASTIPGYEQFGQQVLSDWGAYDRQGLAGQQAMQRHMVEGGDNYANRIEARPLMEARIGTEGARQQASLASAARTNQGATFDAQMQPGRLRGQELTNQGLLNTNENYQTPAQKQAMEVETALLKSQQKGVGEQAKVEAIDTSIDNGIDLLDSLFTREGGAGWSGADYEEIQSVRKTLGLALAARANPGRAPTDADVEVAMSRIPDTGFATGTREVAAALKRLKQDFRGFKPVPAQSKGVNSKGGFSPKQGSVRQ